MAGPAEDLLEEDLPAAAVASLAEVGLSAEEALQDAGDFPTGATGASGQVLMRSRRATEGWGAHTFQRALIVALFFTGFALGARSARASEPTYPALTGRVVDEAGILTDSTRAALIDMLAQHERATGNQVVVVTLKDLQGYTIEDFGYQLGRKWGIGQKEKNNGALLIVAPNEHKVRIEVGYGLEGVLTDALTSVMLQQAVLPKFRAGDVEGGVVAGTDAIIAQLGLDPATAQAKAQAAAQQPVAPP